jgi:O-antigen/teichoic acid export membrane protein
MSEGRSLIRKMGLVGASDMVSRVGSILLLPVLTKSLPLEDYGMWVLIMATTGLIPAIITLGLPYSLVRFLAAERDPRRIREGFYSVAMVVTGIGVLATLILLLLSPQIASVIIKNQVVIVQLLALIILIECVNSVFNSYMRASLSIGTYAFMIMTRTVMNVLLISVLVLSGQGVVGALVGYALSGALVTIFAGGVVMRRIGFALPRFLHIREYLDFGLPTIPSNLSTWVVRSSDRYLIGIFLGAAFVGYYSPGYSLGELMLAITSPLVFILTPALSRYFDDGKASMMRSAYEHAIKYYLLLAIPSVFGLSFMSYRLLQVFSTPSIASNGYLVTPIVAMGSLFLGLYTILSIMLTVEKRTRMLGGLWGLGAVVNTGLNLLLIPFLGIMGAALTTLISFLIITWLMARHFLGRIHISLQPRFLGKSLLASAVLGVLILLIDASGLVGVLLEILLCAGVYFTIMVALKGIGRKELDLLRSVFR